MYDFTGQRVLITGGSAVVQPVFIRHRCEPHPRAVPAHRRAISDVGLLRVDGVAAQIGRR